MEEPKKTECVNYFCCHHNWTFPANCKYGREPEDCTANQAFTVFHVDRIAELEAEVERLKREKDARMYYQDIVYSVCIWLEKIFPKAGRMVCGTLETPETMVQDYSEQAKYRVDELQAALKEAVDSAVSHLEVERELNKRIAELEEVVEKQDEMFEQLEPGLCKNCSDFSSC